MLLFRPTMSVNPNVDIIRPAMLYFALLVPHWVVSFCRLADAKPRYCMCYPSALCCAYTKLELHKRTCQSIAFNQDALDRAAVKSVHRGVCYVHCNMSGEKSMAISRQVSTLVCVDHFAAARESARSAVTTTTLLPCQSV
jgi:hypothetical protein